MVKTEKPEYYKLALEQLNLADNMTDAISAFKFIMHSAYQDKESVANDFYAKWKHEDLVIDKWLAVQATDPSDKAIERVQELSNHEAFAMTNPNKVRALIGSFAGANMQQFHRVDGAGYRYLTEQITSLYSVNPQIAARLTGAFNRWKKFDNNRQLLMKQQLEETGEYDKVYVVENMVPVSNRDIENYVQFGYADELWNFYANASSIKHLK